MSLINDALKKAQKRQDPLSADGAAPAPGAPVTAPAGLRRGKKSMGVERVLLGIVAAVVVLVGLTVVGVLLLKKEGGAAVVAAPRRPAPSPAVVAGPGPAAHPAPVSPPVVSTPPAVSPPAPAVVATVPPPSPPPVSAPPQIAEPAPTPIAHRVAPPAPVPSATVESPPAASPALPSSAPAPVPGATSVQLNLSTPPLVSATPAAPAVAATSPAPVTTVEPARSQPAEVPYHRRVIAFLDTLHVTGVRAAGDDSKVLMNDRVYHLNDVVDLDLGVKLTGISTTVLMFTDENGKIYTKALQ